MFKEYHLHTGSSRSKTQFTEVKTHFIRSLYGFIQVPKLIKERQTIGAYNVETKIVQEGDPRIDIEFSKRWIN